MAAKKDEIYSQIRQVGAIMTIPIILLIGPAVGFWIGSLIDRKFHIYPWFTVIIVGLGFAASGREIVRLLQDIQKDDKNTK